MAEASNSFGNFSKAVVYPMVLVGCLNAVAGLYYDVAGDKISHTYNEISNQLTKSVDSGMSLIVLSSLSKKKATYEMDTGLYCNKEVMSASFWLAPVGTKSSYCRPILDTDLPVIQEWSKLAGVKEPLKVKYVPMQSTTVTPAP